MRRRLFHTFTLVLFLASATGLALAAHEYLESPSHDTQQCTVCQDLTIGSKAVIPGAPSAIAPAGLAVHVPIFAAQQPVIADLNSDISPRAPPLA